MELVFILDRSGSMSGLERDTIGGYNSMLKKQQQIPGKTVVTTVLFDNQYELLHDRIDLMAIAPITDQEYFVRGSTALLDAIGLTIQKIKGVQASTKAEFRAEKVLFVITTDGLENASREYSCKQVRKLIGEQKKIGWEFIFLGANIDAVATAEEFGIAANKAANCHADSKGTQLNYAAISEAITSLRQGKTLAEEWKQAIDKDYRSRKESH